MVASSLVKTLVIKTVLASYHYSDVKVLSNERIVFYYYHLSLSRESSDEFAEATYFRFGSIQTSQPAFSPSGGLIFGC